MVKIKKQYVCSNCGSVFPKWTGKCESCNSWNSLSEQETKSAMGTQQDTKSTSLIECTSLSENTEEAERFSSGIKELDRVLGGGFVLGSSTLIGGNPGIGKSTLLLHIASKLDKVGKSVLYISGEESSVQIKLRAKRLGVENCGIKLANETCINKILASLKSMKIDMLFIDSIQTMYVTEIESVPGTITQVRVSSFELIRTAKEQGFCVILVGHVTKDGQIAGPKILEHMVDTVMYFDSDNSSQYRLLRSFKNRFGNVNEIGIFEMLSTGLQEISNPSMVFINQNKTGQIGTCIFPSLEGTRPILAEIQTLVADSYMPTPRRNTVGYDNNRLSMILAILIKSTQIKFNEKEVHLNIANGIKITDPAADLAIAVALVSSFYNLSLPEKSVFFGELSLSGETRQSSFYKERVKEAIKLGFEKIYMPKPVKEVKNTVNLSGVDVFFIDNVSELKDIFSN